MMIMMMKMANIANWQSFFDDDDADNDVEEIDNDDDDDDVDNDDDNETFPEGTLLHLCHFRYCRAWSIVIQSESEERTWGK